MKQYFKIIGEVKAQRRPRATRRGNFAAVYEDKKDKENKANIRAQIIQQRPQLIKKPAAVNLFVRFIFPRPLNHFNAKGLIKDRHQVSLPAKKPDLDNLLKAVMDAMKSVLFEDDAQVVRIMAWKLYGHSHYTEIEITYDL